MKATIFFFFLFLPLLIFGQSPEMPVEVTPQIELKIRAEIEQAGARLKQELQRKSASALEIEFSTDTLRIELFSDKFMEYDYSTAGMGTAVLKASQEYDRLMNKYYRRLLTALKEADRKNLIEAQRAWLVFRDKESVLIGTLAKDVYTGGGTMQPLVSAAEYLDVIRNRTVNFYQYLIKVSDTF
ncbi:lysozyme inhibitor LprI family protein [Pedobacter sp. SYSU D00535]|uniref:lysozyme inhibitor LprI family protein n=1 Tax=Pedobacter sp. SYSU D00535 TaxID=2810308 RepID=UPI001A96318E|nr:lysozyme inhibitor LprI family protein [Pedobacter sp. SYSU D00535]